MKKRTLLFLFLVTSISLMTQASNDPKLILEIHYTNLSEVIVLQSDTNLSNTFNLKTVQSNESYTRVIHKESGVVLGTFYGTLTKKFIIEILEKQLTPEYINLIVSKLVTLNTIKN